MKHILHNAFHPAFRAGVILSSTDEAKRRESGTTVTDYLREHLPRRFSRLLHRLDDSQSAAIEDEGI